METEKLGKPAETTREINMQHGGKVDRKKHGRRLSFPQGAKEEEGGAETERNFDQEGAKQHQQREIRYEQDAVNILEKGNESVNVGVSKR